MLQNFPQCNFLINLYIYKTSNIILYIYLWTSKSSNNREEFFFKVNYEGTRNILLSMEEKKCFNFIYFSTDMTYGKPKYLPVDTRHQQEPFGPYGASKKASEKICYEYRKKGFNITIFRPRMILGPGRLGVLKKLFKLLFSKVFLQKIISDKHILLFFAIGP